MIIRLITLISFVSVSVVVIAQNCPDNINNSPGNSPNSVTADVYDGGGAYVQTINCESTGNSTQLDCDLPSYNFPQDYFVLIELSNGSNSTTCVYNADGDLIENDPLPVVLDEIYGNVDLGMHNLFWKTASEQNNDHFNVYCSQEGTSWELIGEVTGAGSTSQETSYNFQYRPTKTGINYYKIVQVDYDGNSHILGTISLVKEGVEISNEKGYIQVSSSDNIKSLLIYSLEGKLLSEHNQINSEKIKIQPKSISDSQLIFLLVEVSDGSIIKRKMLY